jgi:hypothetical protein
MLFKNPIRRFLLARPTQFGDGLAPGASGHDFRSASEEIGFIKIGMDVSARQE